MLKSITLWTLYLCACSSSRLRLSPSDTSTNCRETRASSILCFVLFFLLLLCASRARPRNSTVHLAERFPAARFCFSRTLTQCCLRRPFGFSWSVTSGIPSPRGRSSLAIARPSPKTCLWFHFLISSNSPVDSTSPRLTVRLHLSSFFQLLNACS